METRKGSVDSWKIDGIFKNRDSEIILDLLNSKTNILIAGNEGKGKTALLKWIISNLNFNEKLLVFDYFNELDINKEIRKVFKVGYHEECDIVGEMTNVNPHKEMVAKGLLLPFDRVIADDLFVREIENVLSALHGNRSGIFTIPFNTTENALKHIYLKTMYPENKALNKNIFKQIVKDFQYAIQINDELEIQSIQEENDVLNLLKLN